MEDRAEHAVLGCQFISRCKFPQIGARLVAKGAHKGVATFRGERNEQNVDAFDICFWKMTPVQAAIEEFGIAERFARDGTNAARLAINFDIMNFAMFMHGQQESRIR